MSTNVHDIKKEVRLYLIIFAALLFLTVLTVAVSYLHVQLGWAVAIALTIATFKAGLVACFFMHLISERKLIYLILIFTVIFLAVLLILPKAEHHDLIRGTEVVS